jgi:YVTN family beta-propeller protein
MHAPRDRQADAGQRGRTCAHWRGAVVTTAAALSLAAGAVPASAASGYPVTATIPVGSSPLGAAADPAAGTVYVTNDEDNTVSVIDAATRTVTATIPVGTNPKAVAADPATGTTVVVARSLASQQQARPAPAPGPAPPGPGSSARKPHGPAPRRAGRNRQPCRDSGGQDQELRSTSQACTSAM